MNVEYKENVEPLFQRVIDKCPGRAILVTIQLGMFQQFSVSEHGREAVFGKEEVVFAIHLTGSAGPGRDGHGANQTSTGTTMSVEELSADRSLAGSRRPAQYQHSSA